MSQPVIDLKIQLTPDGVPKLLMKELMKGPGKMSVPTLIQLANDSGLKVTLVIEQPGANA